MGKFKQFINQKNLFGEIMRFVFVGGLATLIDFFVMGVTMYIVAYKDYKSFIEVFIGTGLPATSAMHLGNLIGTGVGFTVGLIFNYILSVIFVFNEGKSGKSAKGFVLFALLSIVGLAIHEFGMWGLNVVIGLNEWFVKVLMTAIVLVYNFITRKIILFKKRRNTGDNSAENCGNNLQ